jgi:esterase/lipase
MKFTFLLIQIFFSINSLLFPKFAGKQAFNLFQRPHQKKTRTRELTLFNEFNEKRITFEEEDLFLYEKGGKDKYPVILVHGWESNPGSMYGIAKKLYEEGFRVLVLGLPAHGKSALKKTNMVHASKGIKHLLAYESIDKNFSMVTHSFGSGASALALKDSEIEVDKLIFLTTPDKIGDIFDNFASMIKLGKKAYDHLITLTEELSPVKMEEFNISEFVKNIHFKELYVLHDRNDKILPWENATAMKKCNPDIELIPLESKGHYRLLWDDQVIELILNKLTS